MFQPICAIFVDKRGQRRVSLFEEDSGRRWKSLLSLLVWSGRRGRISWDTASRVLVGFLEQCPGLTRKNL